MIRSLYTAINGLVTQEARQQVSTSNMANANTIGFKGDNLAIRKFEDVLIQNYDKISGGTNVRNVIGSLSFGSRIEETTTNFAQGMVIESESPTNFAIEGRGFFSIQVPNNEGNIETFYSRDGQFNVNSRGYLVNGSGYSVLGRNLVTNNFEPIYIGNNQVLLNSENNLEINGVEQYKLLTADFEDYSRLGKMGDNLYRGENPIYDADIMVKQNSLEKSNVNIIDEMISMMTNMRNFESNQKIIQSLDETLGKAVNEVGAVR